MTLDAPRVAPVRRPVVRRPGLALASVALIAVSIAVFSTLLARASGPGRSVLGVGHLVPVGAVIEASDLTAVRVKADAGVAGVPVEAEGRFVGRRAAIPLLPGSLLVPQDAMSSAVPADGVALVGVGLRPDQLPASGVVVGDRVDAVLTGGTVSAQAASASPSGGATPSSLSGGPGSVLASEAVVVDVAPGAGGPAGASAGGSAVSVVTLEVARSEAPILAAASTAGEVALVVVGPQP